MLRGQNGVTIGSALTWYLRNVAHAQVSWNGDNFALPARLPPGALKARIASPYRHRVYLYLERGKKFFAYLDTQPPVYRDDQLPRGSHRPDNEANDFYREFSRWENDRCGRHESYRTELQGDAVAVAQTLFATWAPVMGESSAHFDWKTSQPKP